MIIIQLIPQLLLQVIVQFIILMLVLILILLIVIVEAIIIIQLIIGYACRELSGGGSNFGGLCFPFIGQKFRGEAHNIIRTTT